MLVHWLSEKFCVYEKRYWYLKGSVKILIIHETESYVKGTKKKKIGKDDTVFNDAVHNRPPLLMF